jgi:ABC-type amino acid transport substrate-binding protein
MCSLVIDCQLLVQNLGISKQNPQLKEILDIALNQITQDEKNKILNKWISTSNNEHKL